MRDLSSTGALSLHVVLFQWTSRLNRFTTQKHFGHILLDDLPITNLTLTL